MPKDTQITHELFMRMSIDEQNEWISGTLPPGNSLNMNKLQIEACRLILTGHCVALLGGPGSGKSFTTDRADYLLHILSPSTEFARTATTGMASTHLNNGKTLYNWLKTGTASCLSYTDAFSKRLQTDLSGVILKNTDVFQVDEASMLSDTAFSHIVNAATKHRNNHSEYLGGMRVILSGDIMQLPVIPGTAGAGNKRKYTVPLISILENLPYNIKKITLTENMRSDGDLKHQAIIKAIVQQDPLVRKRAVELLNEYCYKEPLSPIEALNYSESTGMTIITPTNHQVELYNKNQMELLRKRNPSGPIFIGRAKPLHEWKDLDPIVKANLQDENGLKMEENHIRDQKRFEDDLSLYEGQSIMLRKNTEDYKNGEKCQFISVSEDRTVMTVSRYSDKAILKVTKCDLTSEYQPKIGFEQFPVIKDAAMSVHKAQGSTETGGIIFDPDGLTCFKKDTARVLYVAVSRTQSLSKIILTEKIDPDIIVNDLCQRELQRLWHIDYMSHYPKITLEELNAAFA